MSNMNLITSLLHLPEDALQKIDASTFLLMLPVVPHTCPHYHATTTKVHSYRNQPVKTTLFYSSSLPQTQIYMPIQNTELHCKSY